MEFAIAFPLLITLMLGTITSGLALNDNLQLSHSTREGARYGATVPDDESFSSGTWATNVRTVVVERFGGALTAADVCVALVDGAAPSPLSAAHTTKGDGTACFDDSSAGITDARVQVAAGTPSAIETGFHTFSLTLEAEAVAMHESNV